MALTRREFLTKLATIAIVAPLVPKIIENICTDPVLDPINELTKKYIVPALADNVFQPSPLSLAILEEAYQTCSFGYDEPDMIMMSPDTYAEFISAWNKLPTTARFQREDGELELPYFNGASVTHCNSLPKGSWMEINSKPNVHERYSGMFYKNDLKWHPIPEEL
jgi:hypothetical protein